LKGWWIIGYISVWSLATTQILLVKLMNELGLRDYALS